MTDPNYTAIKIVTDRSGSVSDFLDDAQGALDAFLAGQQEDAKTTGRKITVALAQFDTTYEEVYKSTPVDQVPEYKIVPRGMTALLDAFGYGITEFGEELAGLPEDQRPGTVIFGLLTDGKENSSKEWTKDKVFSLVTQQQQDYGWRIVYLAANQDAVEEGRKLGVAAGSAITYGTSSEEVAATGDALREYVAVASAAPAGASVEFTDEQRKRTLRR